MRTRLSLVASQFGGQLAVVLAMPALTRILEPEELGRYQIAFAVGILLQPFITLRLEIMVPSEGSETVVSQYLKWAIRAGGVIISAMLLLSLICFLTGDDLIAWGILTAAIISCSYAMMAMDNALLIRKKAMRRIAVRNLFSGVLTGLLQVILAYQFREFIWLGIAILLARLGSILVTRQYRNVPPPLLSGEDGASFEIMPVVYRVASDLAASVGLYAMSLYAQLFYGASAAAHVGTAQRSATAPLGLISQALSQSVQATMGEAIRTRDADIARRLDRQLLSLLPYAGAASVGLIVLGPILAVPVLGPGWETTGSIIAVMGVPAGLQLLVAPVSTLFFMLGAEKQLFRIHLARLAASLLIASIFQILFADLVHTALGFSIGMSLGYGYTYVALRRAVLLKQRSFTGDT